MSNIILLFVLFVDLFSLCYGAPKQHALTEDEAKIVAMFGKQMEKEGLEKQEKQKWFVADFLKSQLGGSIGTHSEKEIGEKFSKFLQEEKGVLSFTKILNENKINKREEVVEIYENLRKKFIEKGEKEGRGQTKGEKGQEIVKKALEDEELVKEAIAEHVAIKGIHEQLKDLFREYHVKNGIKIGLNGIGFEQSMMVEEIFKKLKDQGKLDDLTKIGKGDVRKAFQEALPKEQKLAKFFAEFIAKQHGGVINNQKETERIGREFVAKLEEEGKVGAVKKMDEKILGDVLARVVKEHKNEPTWAEELFQNVAKFFGGIFSKDQQGEKVVNANHQHDGRHA